MRERIAQRPTGEAPSREKRDFNPDAFGGWSFNPRSRTLTHPLASPGWYVDLDTCRDGPQLEDWRRHLAEKRWANPPVVAGLQRLVRMLWGASDRTQ